MIKLKLSFLGLGTMGFPMAGYLSRAGHHVTVFNRTGAKADKWTAMHDGTACTQVKQAVADADIVFACVGNDDDVRQICEASFPAMKAGSLFVDHTTASPVIAKQMANKAQSSNIGFVDAPVSGGQAGAENGQLTIMCGGTDEDFRRAEPVMQSYAKAVTHMGPVGAGQATKMVNQVAIAGLLQGLSEALVLGQSQGLDMKKALGAISQGAAGSWQMSNRGHTMVDDSFEFGFAVDWMRKDLAICLHAAQDAGLDLSVTKTVDELYADVQEMGGGRWDTSSLIRRLAKAGFAR